MERTSYPNYTDMSDIARPRYNLNRWIDAMKAIYLQTHSGIERTAALESITKDWSKTEKTDFLNWMKYYESGDQFKYKTAQMNSFYSNENINGYYLPNPKEIPSPLKSVNDQMVNLQEVTKQELEQKKLNSAEEKRRLIEDQRRKLLGRLNSAEKLLTSREGHLFAGEQFEQLLEALFTLKRQVSLTNKISLSSQTIIDLVCREANKLSKKGFNDAGSFLLKIAQQTPGNFNAFQQETPAGGSAIDGGGALGNEPPIANMTPAAKELSDKETAKPPVEEKPEEKEETPKDGMQGFMDNLEGAGITLFPDTNEAQDEIDTGEDEIDLEGLLSDAGLYLNDLVVEAQAADELAPKPAPLKEKAPEAVEKPNTSITTDQVKSDIKPQEKNDFDYLIDSAFKNLTIQDVIGKLEAVSAIYKNREISRQLAIVDLMLDRLQLASYFPALAEAANKSLESNQYILTRLEDVLSKLRGATEGNGLDLEDNIQQPISPEIQKVKNNLSTIDKKEKEKKELRKKVEDQKVTDQALKPEIELESPGEEIANKPVQVEETPQVKPATPINTPKI